MYVLELFEHTLGPVSSDKRRSIVFNFVGLKKCQFLLTLYLCVYNNSNLLQVMVVYLLG